MSAVSRSFTQPGDFLGATFILSVFKQAAKPGAGSFLTNLYEKLSAAAE